MMIESIVTKSMAILVVRDELCIVAISVSYVGYKPRLVTTYVIGRS